MGRQPAKSPVVIDLVDSDSDIEIIHHTIVVLDDETPPEPGPSRPATLQVRHPTQLSGSLVLTAVKRGPSLHSHFPTVKLEGAPPPVVKVEVSPCHTGIGNYQQAEHGPLCGQSATALDETDSDAVSEVDDQYAHVKVCDRFRCYLDLIDYFQVLDEMPWLSESDIKDVPPVIFPIHYPALPHSLCLPARHEAAFTIWPSITKLQKCANISLIPSPIDVLILEQDIQKLNMSEKQSTLQQLFPHSSPWFCIPDPLSVVCTPDYIVDLWLNGQKKLQSVAITRVKHSYHPFHAGTPNWRRPYHLRSSKGFDDWRGLQLLKSQRVAPGSKCMVAVLDSKWLFSQGAQV